MVKQKTDYLYNVARKTFYKNLIMGHDDIAVFQSWPIQKVLLTHFNVSNQTYE